MDADIFIAIVWCLLTPIAAYLTGRAVYYQAPPLYLGLLIGVIAFYLITDAIFIGGFQLDGVTSFPVFAGIVASILWIVIWGISATFGFILRKRCATQSTLP